MSTYENIEMPRIHSLVKYGWPRARGIRRKAKFVSLFRNKLPCPVLNSFEKPYAPYGSLGLFLGAPYAYNPAPYPHKFCPLPYEY